MPRKCNRRVYVEGDCVIIPLNTGAIAIVDLEDLPVVEGVAWLHSTTGYAKRNVRIDGRNSQQLLHRILISAPPGLEVDHIDGDRLNNRRSNLRLATRRQNAWNQAKTASNRSGFKGVSFRSQLQKWRACIKIDGKHVEIGHFATPEEAHAAYADVARKTRGEFAKLA